MSAQLNLKKKNNNQNLNNRERTTGRKYKIQEFLYNNNNMYPGNKGILNSLCTVIWVKTVTETN